MNKRTLIGLFIVVIIIAGILVYFNVSRQGPKKNATPAQRISIGIQANTISALVLVAKGQGFFDELGLDVVIKNYPSGKHALLGMFDNQVNLATAADMPLMSHSFKRDDYSLISTIAHTGNGAWIIARKDHGINSPSDLRGKKIGTQKYSAVHFFLSLFLLHNQIQEVTEDIVFMNAVDLPLALINGEIDAFCMRNPFIAEAKKVLANNAIEFYEPDIYEQTFNLIGGKEFIKSNPTAIVKIVKALTQAENFIRKNREDAIGVTARELGDGRVDEVRQDWDSFHFDLFIDQSLLLTLEDEARWAIRNKLTEETTVPNYLDYIYPDAMNTVKPQAVGLYTAPTKKIIIAEGHQPIVAPIHIADKRGYFSREGLEVTLQAHRSGKACLNAVITGKADLATAGDIPTMYSIMNNKKIFIVATIENTRKNNVIVARRDRGIATPGDLKGKTIGVTLGTGGEFFLDSFLIINEIIKSQVKIVNIKPQQMVDNLLNGTVDAVSTWNPHAIRLQNKLGDNGLIFHGEEIYTATQNIVARQEFVRNNQDTITKLLRAVLNAEHFIRENPDESRDIISDSINIDKTLLLTLWDIYNFKTTLDQTLLLTLRDEARWAIKNKLVPATSVPNFVEYVYIDALKGLDPTAVGISL